LDDEYLDLFLSELVDNIKLLNDALIKLEKNMKDTGPLEEVMRAAHTVKGMAGTMGYENLTRLTHVTESKIIDIRKENIVTKPLIDVLFQVADRMQKFHDLVEEGKDTKTMHIDDLVKFLETFDVSSTTSPTEDETLGLVEDDLKMGQKFNIKIIFDDNTSLRGARGFQILRILDSIATIEDSSPSRADIEDGKLFDNPIFDVITNEDEIKIRNELSNVANVKEIEITRLVEDDIISSPKVKIQRGIQTVRINLNQLDEVVDLLGELILAKIRIEGAMGDLLNASAVEQLNAFESTISTIQDKLMRMRMVNLSRIFETYPRTVRDIASQRGQEIEVLLQGTHIELDRSVIDQVNEAIIHLIRNSATHGIEDASIRKKLGKTEKGTIRISAVQDRGEVVFNVEDDGSGIDVEKVRQKAIEKRLIRDTAVLSRSQLVSLIFHPGFSTADELSSAAGRGVGMDIIKSTIEEIDGSIEIRTIKDKGTLFIIRVPQTLAIIQALTIRIRDYIFVLPMLNIEKIYPLDDPNVVTRENKLYLQLENQVIPIIDLETDLQIPDYLTPRYIGRDFRKDPKQKLILWEKGGKKVGMKVTDVLEQREIVTKQLSQIREFPGFSGATILDEDRVVLIIDPMSIKL
jgi:two-component system, chemotaxis family, sensor kinase CheA